MRNTTSWAGRSGRLLACGGLIAALSACDDVLEVELPHLLTDAAIADPATAELQVNSGIALFECGYSSFGQIAGGFEDMWDPQAGNFRLYALYNESPTSGNCDATDLNISFFDQFAGARALLSNDPDLMTPSGKSVTAVGSAQGVYDRLQGEWDLGTDGERLSAIGAIYVAASLAVMGEFFCEAAIDGSDLMTPPEVLDVADQWVDRALTHIGAYGDFAMPFDIAPSATDMANALRARILWGSQDLAGANAAATAVLIADPEFVAWVTRDTGPTRRNKIHLTGTVQRWSSLLGAITHWNPSFFDPNPATGQAWTSPLPFTGWLFLGVEPDGRTLGAGNVPVRWAEEFRDLGDPPTPIAGSNAVPDPRVTHFKSTVAGPEPGEVPDTYAGEDEDIPYITWQELRLIRADYELHEQGNLQGAIDEVNAIRAFYGLPLISGANEATLLGDADAVRAMLLEERRREFFNEGGRFWSTKIQNTDMLWFPRLQGNSRLQGYQLEGGVRLFWDVAEYEQNDYFGARGGNAARGSGCVGLGSLGGNPGDQVPIE